MNLDWQPQAYILTVKILVQRPPIKGHEREISNCFAMAKECDAVERRWEKEATKNKE